MSLPWYKVWLSALLPSVPIYETIISDPERSIRRGLWWIFASGLIYGLCGFAGIAFGMAFGMGMMIAVVFIATVSQFFALAFGGLGTFRETFYAFSASAAPLNLIFAVLAMLVVVLGKNETMLTVAGLAVLGYATLLNIVAIKTVHRMGWIGAACASAMLWLFIGTAFVSILDLSGFMDVFADAP